ncbi:SGNH/GDSL hydrolase family protein [Saccharococcus caldoxylosilyticus]|uniref:SGNH/GDSL hydrolase family protein n=1 Tax=Saccharococcus caldoxylosilyticus TaxID=81408 RepID=UPI00206C12CC|nr:hypothetical protein PcaKH15_20520 [Parageobacillus caldoxylosilyticus]BDG39931.1 hypothetical protein PcaKH16_20700 [Parageobacillus caldoxylosilyticus]
MKHSTSIKKPINIFLAGDSTVANCPPHEAPMAGWGQVLQAFFTDDVKVYNYAKGGASSNSFIEEGRLQLILDAIEPTDYLFIQFGHNDQKPYGVYCKIKVQRCAKFLCKWLCRGALHGGAVMITCLDLPNLLQLAAWQKNHGCRGSMSSPQ